MDYSTHCSTTKIHGVGLGLRAEHFNRITQEWPDIPWFEVLADNYFLSGGASLDCLDLIAESYPTVLHSIGMSIGSSDPVNAEYITKLKKLKQRIGAKFCSDHLCWSSVNGQYAPDLFPLPLTESVIKHVVAKIKEIQQRLEGRILIENVSSYLRYKSDALNEWEFLNAIATEADCHILLDINNIYVSANNNSFSPEEYIKGINAKRVRQFHLAGFKDCGDYLLDNHGAKVESHVEELYKLALNRFGNIPACVEWDMDIPEFQVLYEEQKKFTKITEDYFQNKKEVNTRKQLASNVNEEQQFVDSKLQVPKLLEQKRFNLLNKQQNLHDLQTYFLNGIYQPTKQDDALANFALEKTQARKRYQVYRGSTFGGLIAACAQVYSVVKQLVGDACFEKLIEHYAAEHIPKSPDLNAFAGGLPKFLASFEPLKQITYLQDIAQLEAYRHTASNTILKNPINVVEKLGLLAPEKQMESVFSVNPSLNMVESSFPILDIWEFHQKQDSEKTLTLQPQGQTVTVWKQGSDVFMVVIAEEMCYAVKLMKDNIPFSELIAQFVAKYPCQDVTQILPQCLKLGWIVNLH